MKKWKKTLLATSVILLSSMAFAGNGQSQANSEFPIPAGFESSFKEINGVKLHYVEGGSGPLVLMVHGYGQTWYEWHQLMPKLAKEHRVVAVDMPGLGQSEPLDSTYSGLDVYPYLHGLAKSFSPDEPFDVVAHDTGVWMTYPMIAQHQDDISKVIYFDSIIPDDTIYTFPSFTPEGEASTWHWSFYTAENNFAENIIEGKEKLFLSHIIKKHATNKEVFTDELLDLYAKSYAKPETLHAAFEYYRSFTTSAEQNKAIVKDHKLKMPVLVIPGDSNGGGLGDAFLNQVKKYGDNVQGETIQGCGHWLPEECPATVEPLVIDFLNKK
ncbi:alpha/beta fold hydrolase [Vibrio sp. 10N.237.312.C02]|uniref:alpha/beta fold hydrolase n=1 Tax=Vibrio TaxID=662 RepID=UPI002469800E|nr:alpha/beta hydrolase [Vibrio splendidus]MDH5934107.1 alpha/beta hydrolase [Vibrio splendidus]